MEGTETGSSGLGPLESGFDGGLGAETDWPEGKREGGKWGDSEERQLFVHFGTAETRGRAGSGGNECLRRGTFKKDGWI